MADEVRVRGEGAEAPGETIHLPGPSYLPALTAAGITLAVVGIVISWIVTGIGLIIAVIAIWRWIREAREEISELPLEH